MDDLKYNMLDKLISVEDEELLKKINNLLKDVDLEERPIKVSDAQRQMLINSEHDILKGNLISDEDVNEEEEQWLKKYSGLKQRGIQGGKYLNMDCSKRFQ